jgi:hypothetical protein
MRKLRLGELTSAEKPALASLRPKVMETAVSISMERMVLVLITAPFSTGRCFPSGKGSFDSDNADNVQTLRAAYAVQSGLDFSAVRQWTV